LFGESNTIAGEIVALREIALGVTVNQYFPQWLPKFQTISF
jgi:hypothetical protein